MLSGVLLAVRCAPFHCRLIVCSVHALRCFLPILQGLLGQSLGILNKPVRASSHTSSASSGIRFLTGLSKARLSFPAVFTQVCGCPVHQAGLEKSVLTFSLGVWSCTCSVDSRSQAALPVVPITHEPLCFIPKGLPIHPGSHSVNLQAM